MRVAGHPHIPHRQGHAPSKQRRDRFGPPSRSRRDPADDVGKWGGPSSLRRSARRDAVSGRRRHRVLGSRSKARRGLPASPPRAPDPDSAGATVELTSSKACWLANNVVARTGAYGWHHHRDIEGGTAGKPNTKNAPVGMDAPSTKLRPVGPTNREATW